LRIILKENLFFLTPPRNFAPKSPGIKKPGTDLPARPRFLVTAQGVIAASRNLFKVFAVGQKL
jgi:hypothetical protein